MAEGYENLLEKAREAVKRKNFDFASALYLQVLTMEPDHEKASRELRAAQVRGCQEAGRNPAGDITKKTRGLLSGMFGKIKKDADKVIMSYENILKKAPYNINVLMQLAAACKKAGYMNRAVINYETVLEVDRENVDANRELGRLYKESGKLPEAEKHFNRVLKAVPHDPEATRAIKDIAASSTVNKLDKAGDSYRDKLKDAGSAERLEARQHIIRTDDDMKRAIAIALEDLEETPEDSKALRRVGDLYFKSKNYDEAEKYFKKAVEVNPQDFFAKDKVADVGLARIELAVAQANEKYRTEPTEANLQVLNEAKKKKVEFSIEEWKRRVENHPTDMRLRFELGSLYFKARNYDEAITHLQKTTTDPQVAVRAHFLLGMSFVNNQLFELGIDEFQKALQNMGKTGLNEQRKEIVYNLARTFEMTGKTEEALKEFRAILSEDYNYKDVKERVASLKAKMEN